MGDKPKTYTLPGDYEHRGTTYACYVNRRVVKSPEIVNCRPDDVFISTYPKSGTTVTIEMVTLIMNGGDVEASRSKPQICRTPMVEMIVHIPIMFRLLFWVLQIIKSLVPGFLKGYIKVPSKDELQAANGLEFIDKIPSPRLIKTHLPYHCFPTQAIKKKCKTIYVARNPKDVAYSFYHHNQVVPDVVSFRGPWAIFFETYLQGKVCYGDWFDHVLGWWKHKDDENILFLKYEDLKKDPRAYARKIAAFLDINMPEDMEDRVIEYCSVKSMKKNPAVNIEHMTRNKDKDAGFIRKGTTWATEMVSLVVNGGNIKANLSTNQIVRCPIMEMYIAVPKLEWLFYLLAFLKPIIPWFIQDRMIIPEKGTISAMNSLKHIESMQSPRVLRSHLPYCYFPTEAIQKKSKIIYVVRNPKDTAVSYYHFYKLASGYGFKDGTWNMFYDLFINKKVDYGDWFDHVLGWWKHKDDGNVLFLKYEDMKRDAKSSVEKIAEFLNVDLNEQTVDDIVDHCSFEKMKRNPTVNMENTFKPNYISPGKENSFIRKGVVGGWRDHFTVNQNTEFDQVYKERMAGCTLDFEW
ncbi:uncharacterized protein LOC144451872 [Glandiceps talaboti]